MHWAAMKRHNSNNLHVRWILYINIKRGRLRANGAYCVGSAGVAVAAYIKQRDAGLLAGRTCVILCCGGNVSDAMLDKARVLVKI